MAPPSFSSDTPPFEGLKKLPAELCIQIMHSCNSLEDVRSFITASPKALSCFQENRCSILRPYVIEVETEFYGSDLIPLALTMMKLRSIQSQASYSHPLQVPRQIQPILESILNSSCANMHQGWRENLPSLITLRHLIPEIRKAMNDFLMQTLSLWANRIQDGPIPQPLSRMLESKFLGAWLRYQSHLSIFHSFGDVRLHRPGMEEEY